MNNPMIDHAILDLLDYGLEELTIVDSGVRREASQRIMRALLLIASDDVAGPRETLADRLEACAKRLRG